MSSTHTGAVETRRRRIGAASSAGERLLSRFTSAGVLCFCGRAGRCGASAASAEMAAPTPPCIPAARCDGGDLRGTVYRDAATTARGARGKCGAAGWVWKAAPAEGRCGATPERWNGRIALTCSPPSVMEGKGRATGEYDGCAVGIGRGAYECPRWGSVTALESGAAPTAPGCLGSAALTYSIPNRSTTAYSLLHRCSILFWRRKCI
jgi:hypothetical protein